MFQFLLVAICISINVPAGVFVPSFVIGAAGGRLTGETMSYLFPEGIRGAGGPPVYPGLYAVVGMSEWFNVFFLLFVKHTERPLFTICMASVFFCLFLQYSTRGPKLSHEIKVF